MVRIVLMFVAALVVAVALMSPSAPGALAASSAAEPFVESAPAEPRADVPVERIPRTLRGLVPS